jgi:hypothetical protein
MNGNMERLPVEFPPTSYPLIGESAGARDIAAPLLRPDDAGKGFAGRIERGERIELQASGLADAAILAGKRGSRRKGPARFPAGKTAPAFGLATVSPVRRLQADALSAWVHAAPPDDARP